MEQAKWNFMCDCDFLAVFLCDSFELTCESRKINVRMRSTFLSGQPGGGGGPAGRTEGSW